MKNSYPAQTVEQNPAFDLSESSERVVSIRHATPTYTSDLIDSFQRGDGYHVDGASVQSVKIVETHTIKLTRKK